MRLLTTLSIFSALAFVGGCARAKITTELKPDGSWDRIVELTGPAKQEGMQMSSLEDAFQVPTGAGWKSSESAKDTDRILTVRHTFAVAASTKGDLSIKEGDIGKLALVNEATVKRLGPSRVEYTETLRWTGAKPKSVGAVKPEDLAQLKAALPPALATDENANALAVKTAALALPVLFGPGDPLLALGLLHPELAQRRATQRIGLLLVKALEEQFGDKMAPAARRDVARKLIETTFATAKPAKPDPAAGPAGADKGSATLVPLMFILRGPGKVVSSNGETDELTGEVYWALFPEAAALKPVTLTAVWELR